jgi:hypothetical protein
MGRCQIQAGLFSAGASHASTYTLNRSLLVIKLDVAVQRTTPHTEKFGLYSGYATGCPSPQTASCLPRSLENALPSPSCLQGSAVVWFLP